MKKALLPLLSLCFMLSLVVCVAVVEFGGVRPVPGEEARLQSAKYLKLRVEQAVLLKEKLAAAEPSVTRDEAMRRLEGVAEAATHIDTVIEKKQLHSGWSSYGEQMWDVKMRYIDWAISYAERALDGKARAKQVETSLKKAQAALADYADCPARDLAQWHLKAAELDHAAAMSHGWEPELLDLSALESQEVLRICQKVSGLPPYREVLERNVREEHLNPAIVQLRQRVFMRYLRCERYSNEALIDLTFADLILEKIRHRQMVQSGRTNAYRMSAALVNRANGHFDNKQGNGFDETLYKGIRELAQVRAFTREHAPYNEEAVAKINEAETLLLGTLDLYAGIYTKGLDGYQEAWRQARLAQKLLDEAQVAAWRCRN